jgi:hypothetical protein
MALKDINFKQLLIEKGERIGLMAAGAITALLVVSFGLMSALSGSSPSKNTDKLKDLRTKAQTAWQMSRPPDDLNQLPTDLKVVDVRNVQADSFGNPVSYFVTLEGEDRKWRLPKVMGPDDFQVDLVRGAFQTYMIYQDPKDPKVIKFAVLSQKGSTELTEEQKKMKEEWDRRYRTEKQNRRMKAITRLQQALGQAQGAGIQGGGKGGAGAPGVAAPSVGVPGGGNREGASAPLGASGGGGKGGMGGGGFPAFGTMPGAQGPANTTPDQEIKWVLDEKLADEKGKLAETNLPVRMIVVTATFPYKEQLEEFSRALRFGSVDELLRDEDLRPEFAGYIVQRRVFGPDGKQIEDWTDLDLETPIKFIRMRAKEIEPFESDWLSYQMIPQPNRLVIPLPKLAREQKYPDVKLEGIQQTVKNLNEAGKENIAPPPKKSRLDIDVFDIGDAPATQQPGDSERTRPGNIAGGAPGKGMNPDARFPGATSGRAEATITSQRGIAVPDKILVRFFDPTVQPGYSYEYQLRLRMDNPTHKQPKRAVSVDITREPELLGDWKQVTWKDGDKEITKVHIPDELLYYAGEEKSATKDKVVVQVHRWLEYAQAKWNQRGSEIPVGDWSMLEKRLVARGEYIGEIREVEVATWNPTQERYTLAVHPDDQIASTKRTGPRLIIRRHKGIAIDFATDPVYTSRPLLVDFRGGEHPKQTGSGTRSYDSHGPVELLILDADGKLIVRNSRVDTEDKERKERFAAWQGWINQVKAQGEESKDKAGDLFRKSGEGRKPGGGEGR